MNVLGDDLYTNLAELGADVTLLRKLLAVHRRLWGLEDQARSQAAEDREIARVKRRIDRQNADRHRIIELLDRSLKYPEPSRAIRRYSETVGELCDRILILTLKIEALGTLGRDATLPEGERTRCLDKLDDLVAWRDHLHHCLQEQIRQMLAGQARLPPRAEFKLYNERLLNPVTRQEEQAILPEIPSPPGRGKPVFDNSPPRPRQRERGQG